MAYCKTYGQKARITPTERGRLKGIGGEVVPLGTTNIRIPFRDLKKNITVDFMVLKESVPKLMSLRDRITRRFYVSLQRQVIMHGGHEHELGLTN